MTTTAIRGALLLTPERERQGDLLIQDDAIFSVGPTARPADVEIDGAGMTVTAGRVLPHAHLGRTLLTGDEHGCTSSERAQRERDLTLADAADAYRSGMQALVSAGFTSVLTMASNAHAETALACAAEVGLRATIGIDLSDAAATTAHEWDTLLRLTREWHGAERGRLRIAIAPATHDAIPDALWADALDLAIRADALVHTHVTQAEGDAAVTHLGRIGALTRRTVLISDGALSPSATAAISHAGTTLVVGSDTTPTLARMLGPGPRFGTLRPGAKADVTVFEGATPRTVLVDGRVILRG